MDHNFLPHWEPDWQLPEVCVFWERIRNRSSLTEGNVPILESFLIWNCIGLQIRR